MNPAPHVCPTCHQPIRRVRPGREPMTTRQRVIYDYIRDAILAGQPCPPVRRIGEVFGIRSTNGVADHLKRLAGMGWIVRSETRGSYTLPFEEVQP